MSLLTISSYCTVAASPDRPEIFLDVRRPTADGLDWLVQELLEKGVNASKTVIYCPTVNSVTKVFELFLHRLRSKLRTPSQNGQNPGLLVDMYSGAIDEATKPRNLQMFTQQSTLRVLICTVAFGMGIDIPDIRNVILYGLPKGFCEYWQEVGRACRDKSNGKAVLYTYPVPHQVSVSPELKLAIGTSTETCIRLTILQKLWLPEMGNLPSKGEMCNKACSFCQCQYCKCCAICKKKCPCMQ